MAEETGFGSAAEILAQKLRKARQSKGLTVEEVSRELNINREHIDCMEAGNMTFLPAVYVYAFLKEYADALGVDDEPLLERCRDELSIPTEAQVLKQVPEPGSSLSLPNGREGFAGLVDMLQDSVPLPVLVTGAVVILVVLLLAVGLFFSGSDEPSPGEAPSTEQVTAVEEPPAEQPAAPLSDTNRQQEPLIADTLAVKSEPWAADVSFLPEDPAAPFQNVLVIRVVKDMTWVKVVADDGDIVYPGSRFSAGEVLRYEAKESFWVNIGRPSYVELYLNGEKVPPLEKRTVVLGKN